MKTLKRRRKENRTDYLKRLKFLKSGKPRIVFRKTNRNILAQYVTSEQAQDKVEIGITSKQLLKYGWPKKAEGSLKSITASYLTGFLFGKKISDKPASIIDFGMTRNLHKTKIYAFLKGLTDAGVKVKHDAKVFPDEKRIKGEHMKSKIPFGDVKSKIENEK